MSFPCALSLRSTPAGVRLCQMPVREIECLREDSVIRTDVALLPGRLLDALASELLDIEAEIEPWRAKAVEWSIRGNAIRYDAEKHLLSCCGKEAHVDLAGGLLRLRILLDRTSLELFSGDGNVGFHQCFLPDAANPGVDLVAHGGEARMRSLAVHRLRSAW